jgi:phosphatidylserine synthase
VAAVLVFGRPPLVFGAFACALWVMFTHFPPAYMLGLSLLLLALAFDWFDGWFAARYTPNSRLGPLVDRMVDRIVLSIIFPVLGAGMLWRFNRLQTQDLATRQQLLHALFVLSIAVIVLLRDQFVMFLRRFALGKEQDVESVELTRLRTLLAFPLAVLLYAYAFYLPTAGYERFYRALDWIDSLDLRLWFTIELLFLLINIVSLTLFLRRYGPLALDDICENDELLRRRILAVIPNGLTMMNAVLGITGVVFASYGRVREALFVLAGAAFFDRLDGLAARRLGLTDPLPDHIPQPKIQMGALLDDISDGISFCLAPAAIFYLVMTDLDVELPLPVGLLAALYALAGVARLIYFTLDKAPVPGFFKGMPVPAAALLVTAPVEMAHQFSRSAPEAAPALAALATAVLGLAIVVMNLYPVRYLHIGRLMGRRPLLTWCLVVLWLGMMFTPYFGVTILVLCSLYVASPLFTSGIDPAKAAVEGRAK